MALPVGPPGIPPLRQEVIFLMRFSGLLLGVLKICGRMLSGIVVDDDAFGIDEFKRGLCGPTGPVVKRGGGKGGAPSSFS